MVASGAADIGIIPAFELTRQSLAVVPGVGIASRGAVRSILLISKCPAAEIRTLAGDTSSRTSVALARIVLARKFGTRPTGYVMPSRARNHAGGRRCGAHHRRSGFAPRPPSLPYHVYDLGREWTEWTGLPMVFAVWAGPSAAIGPATIAAFQESARYGREHLDEIVAAESRRRDFASGLVRRYLTEHIVCELGAAEEKGMELTSAIRAGTARWRLAADRVHGPRRRHEFRELISWPSHLPAMFRRTSAAISSSGAPARISAFTSSSSMANRQ